jgi:Cys-rich protein (TIGR01571 family)
MCGRTVFQKTSLMIACFIASYHIAYGIEQIFDETNTPFLIAFVRVVQITALIFLIMLMIQLREHIRNRYQIIGSCCEDCLTSTCCFYCALSQMSRHLMPRHPAPYNVFHDPGPLGVVPPETNGRVHSVPMVAVQVAWPGMVPNSSIVSPPTVACAGHIHTVARIAAPYDKQDPPLASVAMAPGDAIHVPIVPARTEPAMIRTDTRRGPQPRQTVPIPARRCFQLIVPAGIVPGAAVNIRAPDGTIVQASVPPDVGEGQILQVLY